MEPCKSSTNCSKKLYKPSYHEHLYNRQLHRRLQYHHPPISWNNYFEYIGREKLHTGWTSTLKDKRFIMLIENLRSLNGKHWKIQEPTKKM